MISKDIELSRIIPLQGFGVSAEHLASLECVADQGREFEPIFVTPYSDITTEENFLLIDGTHRAYLKSKRAATHIGALIFETDDDVEDYYPSFYDTYESLREFKIIYALVWRQELKKVGINSLKDLPVVPGSRELLFASQEQCAFSPR